MQHYRDAEMTTTVLVNQAPDPPFVVCTICQATVQSEEDACALVSKRGAALKQHLLTHSSSERMCAAFRAILPHIPAEKRAAAIRCFYKRLDLLRDDSDRQSVYSITEVLGIAPLYQLWLCSR